MPVPCAVCNQPASHTCSGCKLVNYCSKDHQKIHWKSEHKGNCKALFKIERNEVLGRYVVATRDIKKGELIFHEPPLVVGPKAVSLPVCLGCHELVDIQNYHECDGCGFPLCSAKCQVSDYHFDECRLMMEKKYRAKFDMNEEKLQKETRYFPIVPLRCLLLQNSNPEKYKKLMDLQSHLEEKMKTPLFALYKKHVADFLKERLGLEHDEKTILSISGILDTNAFEVGSSEAKTSRLRGLYSTASMIAHSCKPNTRHTFYGTDFMIAVSATTDIAAGETIFATYTQTFWGTMARREHLKNIKCFDCCCVRCSDRTELGTYLGAIRCTKCKLPEVILDGPYVVSTEPLNSSANWKCQNCEYSISGRQIKYGNDSLKEEIMRINKRSPEEFEKFISKYSKDPDSSVLHPKNYHILQVKHALIQLYGNIPGYLLSGKHNETVKKNLLALHDVKTRPKFKS